jgi:hypothetical protein
VEIKMFIEDQELIDVIKVMGNQISQINADLSQIRKSLESKPARTTKSKASSIVEPDPKPEIKEPVIEEPKPEIREPECEAYSIEEVRLALSKLTQAGKTDGVRALISSFGVPNLSSLAVSKYSELLEKAAQL